MLVHGGALHRSVVGLARQVIVLGLLFRLGLFLDIGQGHPQGTGGDFIIEGRQAILAAARHDLGGFVDRADLRRLEIFSIRRTDRLAEALLRSGGGGQPSDAKSPEKG
ncbi:hypothetical protein AUC71_12875 [Methyloceanibacter marginalis]|uniref:Uncharacterized protein n=1 Tax=Methyloceanibacter marginalis TaxID=1774971 RepID=A0A1E3WAN3_9HYPH|nr:hypothetical protein AUC71_12875 [Methyloceanibacter marginalis]